MAIKQSDGFVEYTNSES